MKTLIYVYSISRILLFTYAQKSISEYELGPKLYSDIYDSALYSKLSTCISKQGKDIDFMVQKCLNNINHQVGLCSNENFWILQISNHSCSYDSRSGIGKSLSFTNKGYIALDHDKKKILLVFNGSRTWVDWSTDSTIQMVSYEPRTVQESSSNAFNHICRDSNHKNVCKVHKGFISSTRSSFKSYYPIVCGLVKEYPDYELLITGHSLGGAIAILSGMEFRLNGIECRVHTFGSPKTGNNQFNQSVDTLFETSENYYSFTENHKALQNVSYVRVVHKGDSVPKSPIGTENIWYSHSGIELRVNKPELPHEMEDVMSQESKTHSDCEREKGAQGETGTEIETNISSSEHRFTNNVQKEPFTNNTTRLNNTKTKIAYIPSFKRKAHSQYFVVITSCKQK